MTKEERIEYLEAERVKLWERIEKIELKVNTSPEKNEQEVFQILEHSKNKFSEITEVFDKITETQHFIENLVDEISGTKNDLEKVSKEISVIYEGVIKDGHGFTKTLEEVNEQAPNVISQIHEVQEIISNREALERKVQDLKTTFDKIDDYDSKVTFVFKTVSEKKKEIDEIYYDIFGYKDVDENGREIEIQGKIDKLEKSYDSLSSEIDALLMRVLEIKNNSESEYEHFAEDSSQAFNKKLTIWTDSFEKVLNDINNLLPNALTTGLSYAYSDKKKEEMQEFLTHKRSFAYAIWGMIGVSMIPFVFSIVSLIDGTELGDVILRIPRLALAILPLYIPVLWVAYSSNRKMNLSKRLIEEYSHKEVLSKTFEGLSKQIQNVEDNEISNDLKIKLLYNILDVNSENPGKLISDYNKSDHPLMDALDKSVKLTNAVTKLSKIPGFSKLAGTLQEKANVIMEEEMNKANSGIEAIKRTDPSKN